MRLMEDTARECRVLEAAAMHIYIYSVDRGGYRDTRCVCSWCTVERERERNGLAIMPKLKPGIQAIRRLISMQGLRPKVSRLCAIVPPESYVLSCSYDAQLASHAQGAGFRVAWRSNSAAAAAI